MKILVCIHSQFAMWNIPPAHVERLRRDFPRHQFVHAIDDEQGVSLIGDAEAAFMGTIQRQQLAAAAKLRWIHSPAAGVGGMLFPEMLASPVVITNSKGMSADTIGEHVIAVTLALFRRLPHAFRSQQAREWAQDEIGLAGHRSLFGSRVLVVGLGAIGKSVARRMAALGAHVVGVRRTAGGRIEVGMRDVATPDRLPALLPNADVVVVSAPHTRDTR